MTVLFAMVRRWHPHHPHALCTPNTAATCRMIWYVDMYGGISKVTLKKKVTLVAHWTACVWNMVAWFEESSGVTSWYPAAVSPVVHHGNYASRTEEG